MDENDKIIVNIAIKNLTLEEIKKIHEQYDYKCAKCPLRILGATCSTLRNIDLDQIITIEYNKRDSK